MTCGGGDIAGLFALCISQASVGPGAVMREPDVDQAIPLDTGKTQGRVPGVVAMILR